MSFDRFAGRLALFSFLACLVTGLLVVGWRAKSRKDSAQAAVRAEALAQAAAIEAELNQTLAAAETLGVLVRQSSGSFPNFTRTGTDLLAIWPGLDSLELQPGGVVSDIVPRTGHERLIGFNVLNDPATRPGANAAMQRRAATTAGPLPLANGEMGLVARAPVFLRGRDNRETFWGFTAASMRFSQAIARARLAELSKRGLEYVCFVPASGPQKAVTLAAQRTSSSQDLVQEPIRTQNVELRLALRPRGGWVSKTKMAFEIIAVLIVSGLTGLLVSVLENRHALEMSLEETNQRLARETADRQKADDELRKSRESAASANSRQAELERVRTALQQAQQTITDLQARLQAATLAEKENAATVLTRLQQDQATIADLQAHLEAATRSAREASEASAVKITALEETNEKLKRGSTDAKQAEAKVEELNGLLQQAQAESNRLRETLARFGRGAGEKAQALPPADQDVASSPNATAPASPGENLPPPEFASGPAAPTKPATEPGTEKKKKRQARAPVESAAVSAEPATESNGNGNATSETPPAPLAPAEEAAQAIAPELPAEKPEAVETLAPRATVPGKQKPVKAARRKARRDDQLDLFAGALKVEDSSAPASPVVKEKPLPETGELLTIEPPTTHDQPSAESQPAEKATAVAEVPPAAAHEQPLPNKVAVPETSAQTGDASPADQKALRKFVEAHAGAVEKIRDDLVQGDPVAAQKQVQTLKTAAQEVGATEVQNTAAALAQAIHDQTDPGRTEFLWADLQKAYQGLAGDLKPAWKPKEEKPRPARPLPAPPPVNPAHLRKAVNLIVPLLTDQDPGAKDCVKDNRDTFRSTFTPEGYVEFEKSVKGSDFNQALEQLRKATRKHGISV